MPRPEGRGDGEKAAGLKDDFGFPSAANLTTGQFSPPGVKDIFRTMSTGLSGTPMPSFSDTLAEADRWALSFYVLSLSAFKDPLTGEPIAIADRDRMALNNPGLAGGRIAHGLQGGPDEQTVYYAGEAWARKRGFDFAGAPPNGALKMAPPASAGTR
jgi:cytochrome c oxidase cbb3-type subunit 2